MPFTIAVLLTFLTFILALFLTSPSNGNSGFYIINVLEYWESGLWDGKYLIFALQMMLMLVLGHSLALTKPVNFLMKSTLTFCKNTANAAAIVTFLTVVLSLFNWALGLIFGAIFARKVAEFAKQNNYQINYPVIGACGYSGLMVWHGGLSGSAPIKITEADHFFADLIGSVPLSETIFSGMNIFVSVLLIVILPLAMYLVGKRTAPSDIRLKPKIKEDKIETIEGAERLDHSSVLAYLFVTVIIVIAIYKAFLKPEEITLSFITPNFINLILLASGIALHGNFRNFINAVDDAIVGAAGILIQFPLYFGIMGIMSSSGLVTVFSEFFVEISNSFTYPLFTFVSAGIVNLFVPSGGGQWAVQGQIIIEAAQQLNVSIPKSVMAMAYGDQLTNMLQPFWALPLLGITGLKAKEILPYTLVLMILGVIIFSLGLVLF